MEELALPLFWCKVVFLQRDYLSSLTCSTWETSSSSGELKGLPCPSQTIALKRVGSALCRGNKVELALTAKAKVRQP